MIEFIIIALFILIGFGLFVIALNDGNLEARYGSTYTNDLYTNDTDYPY